MTARTTDPTAKAAGFRKARRQIRGVIVDQRLVMLFRQRMCDRQESSPPGHHIALTSFIDTTESKQELFCMRIL